ncbi:hypothetical protein SAMN05421866_4365 [Chryseobacterium oranimense]|uniref:Uncharacterized protein n=1 Tax=Chryseobacterium oranimense TaxID=421058 RepID=A0A1M5X4P4_9FLAO|nr:hypothetical protein SAMN05421866_4365 [Chryseobacterium oranimense]
MGRFIFVELEDIESNQIIRTLSLLVNFATTFATTFN